MKEMIERKQRMRGQGGFTLIELLVVIAILGILAAVVVFAVGGASDNGQAAACKLEARTVKTAVQAFKAKTGNYPTSYADMTTAGATGNFLEAAPTLVTVTFGTPPTYAWAGGAGGTCGSLTPAITP
jgi:general secretion pathway protein G